MSFLEFTVPPFPVFIVAGEGVFKKRRNPCETGLPGV